MNGQPAPRPVPVPVPAPRPVHVLAGPTASGKSALALDLAARIEAETGAEGAVVVNADSMQIYGELSVLTARPGPAETAAVPHRLYGVGRAAAPWSAAAWRVAALAEIDAAHAAGRVPILVGGTGFYLRALMEGLSPIPEVPPAIRAEQAALFDRLGGPAFHARLAARDPEMAARLDPGDRQRLIRAAEILAATGRSLAVWQAEPPVPPPPGLGFELIALTPPRDWLYPRIEARFDAMMAAGALAEVHALQAAGLDGELPAMKAVGMAPLARHLAGEISRAEAVAAAKTASRRYAKRQLTWIRHQLAADRLAARVPVPLRVTRLEGPDPAARAALLPLPDGAWLRRRRGSGGGR